MTITALNLRPSSLSRDEIAAERARYTREDPEFWVLNAAMIQNAEFAGASLVRARILREKVGG